eukprot:522341-Alexandrium_andersonii.AAC.1
MAPTTTMPVRTVTSSGPARPEERSEAAAAEGGKPSSSSGPQVQQNGQPMVPAEGGEQRPAQPASQSRFARATPSAEGGWAQM